MKTILHPSKTRGHANHGWLDSYHSFSFAGYHNPDRMNFGVLRVLNDDTVSGSMGFGAHPHHNMEIISIPLSGDLDHKDSTGITAIIKNGDIQASVVELLVAVGFSDHVYRAPEKRDNGNEKQVEMP